MAYKNKTTLKSYFEIGDGPTQAQFGDLIDTLVAISETGGSFGAGSIPLIVTGANYGYVGNDFLGITSSSGTQKAGIDARGMTFDNIGNYFKMQHYTVSAWDMSTTANKTLSIASEIPTIPRVVGVNFVIYSDAGVAHGQRSDIYWSISSAGTLILIREDGGFFATSGLFTGSGTRARVTVIYDETLT